MELNIQGEGINFSNLSKSPSYPLIHGESAKTESANLVEARYALKFESCWIFLTNVLIPKLDGLQN